MAEVHHELVPELEEVVAAEHNGRIFGTLALGFGVFGPLVRGVTTGGDLALIGGGRRDAIRSGVARGITCEQWKKLSGGVVGDHVHLSRHLCHPCALPRHVPILFLTCSPCALLLLLLFLSPAPLRFAFRQENPPAASVHHVTGLSRAGTVAN